MLNEYEGKGHEDPSGPKVNDVDRFANSLLSVQCPETPGHWYVLFLNVVSEQGHMSHVAVDQTSPIHGFIGNQVRRQIDSERMG